MGFSSLRRSAAASLLLSILAGPASAHHLMGGKIPSTFVQGLLSGLGHPVIGADHLAFLIAVGVIIGVARFHPALSLTFVVAMGFGVMLHVNGVNLPVAETAVAATVLMAGALIARGRVLPVLAWAMLFVIAGIAHGFAYGESIYGAERSPMAAYLLGLVLIQGAIVLGVAVAARRAGPNISAVSTRLAGAAIGGVGAVMLVVELVGSG